MPDHWAHTTRIPHGQHLINELPFAIITPTLLLTTTVDCQCNTGKSSIKSTSDFIILAIGGGDFLLNLDSRLSQSLLGETETLNLECFGGTKAYPAPMKERHSLGEEDKPYF